MYSRQSGGMLGGVSDPGCHLVLAASFLDSPLHRNLFQCIHHILAPGVKRVSQWSRISEQVIYKRFFMGRSGKARTERRYSIRLWIIEDARSIIVRKNAHLVHLIGGVAEYLSMEQSIPALNMPFLPTPPVPIEMQAGWGSRKVSSPRAEG